MLLLKRIAPVCFLFFLMFGCELKQTTRVVRPVQTWAQRSVLDYRPRMLTLALDSVMYAAYDLENCRFYKAWRGGVNWDGIVFNDTKVIQPTTWGTSYAEDPINGDAWWVHKNNTRIIPEVRFEGYSFRNGQIYIAYTLKTPEEEFYIEERPEYSKSQGAPVLERVFFRSSQSTLPVYLETQGQVLELKQAETILRTVFDPIPEQFRPTELVRTEDKGRYWLEKSDCFTCHQWSENNVGPGFGEIAKKYSDNDQVVDYLVNKVKLGGSGVWGATLMNPHPNLVDEDIRLMVNFILSLDGEEDAEKKKSIPKQIIENVTIKPGHGAPLEDVHPSYNLVSLEPPGYQFTVGGLAFFPDGRLLVTTWTPEGSVYILDGVQTGDSSQVTVKLIAQGLMEPLGAEVVNGNIYVLQKNELTQLVDLDGDHIVDEFKSICNSFGVSNDFHEFAFGLIFKDEHFYANLSIPMRLMANEQPLPDRGRTIKIAMDGSFERINWGLRQPNGIGFGANQEIFVTDNQGEWLPGNKFIHVKPGGFYGMRRGLPDSLKNIEDDPPAIWLPQDEIANSPSQPTEAIDGPYKGQMLFGDVSHGGIKRAFLEEVNGEYQGVVFRFTQGLKAGVNRLRWGPDGALYIGQAGMIGGWSWKGERSGLQRLKYNGKSTFEMLEVRSRADGFEIEFTEPLGIDQGNSPVDYFVQQWWYLPTPSYGGPKMDLTTLDIKRVRISDDRKTVSLHIPGLKKKHVIYFRLNDQLTSDSGNKLWSGEAWYTLNAISEFQLLDEVAISGLF